MELAVIKGNLDQGAYGSGQRAVLSLYGNFLTIKLGLYAGRNDNCFFTNTLHCYYSLRNVADNLSAQLFLAGRAVGLDSLGS